MRTAHKFIEQGHVRVGTEVVTDPKRMAHMSARNLEKAKAYREKVLRERRLAFYRHVRETTEAWVKAKK